MADLAALVDEGRAAGLHIDLVTVKAHIGRALTKIGADNRVQLAILVHDAEWD